MKIKNYAILIVEDEFIALEYLSQILLSLRAKNIFKASSAKEALEIVKTNTIDLVFMDINIQGNQDGIECASLLNKEYFLPVIFTTAYSDTNTINDARSENIFGYLIKPFQANDVEAAFNVALSLIEQFDKFKLNKTEEKICKKEITLAQGYSYDIKSKTLTFNNTFVDLTKKELEVLDILALNINKNISYDYIKELIWSSKNISDSTIRDIISRLKKKLPNIHIHNIANYGYVLKNHTF